MFKRRENWAKAIFSYRNTRMNKREVGRSWQASDPKLGLQQSERDIMGQLMMESAQIDPAGMYLLAFMATAV